MPRQVGGQHHNQDPEGYEQEQLQTCAAQAHVKVPAQADDRGVLQTSSRWMSMPKHADMPVCSAHALIMSDDAYMTAACEVQGRCVPAAYNSKHTLL